MDAGASRGIPLEEYRDRQRRAREAVVERGLSALVAVSRGGGTHDRVADCLWLAGLVSPQPFVPDLPGRWRGAGHVAVVLGAEGPTTAVVDSVDLQRDPVADRVVVADDAVAAAGDAVAAVAGKAAARVAVLGTDVVPACWWAALVDRVRSRAPGARLEPVDELGFELRRVKSPAEQELLRAAGWLGASAMSGALEAALPGSSEAEVAAALVERVVRAGGAIYDAVVSSGAWSGTLAPSGGAAGVAGWTTRRLARGDLLRLDAYGSMGGYMFDLARSLVIGGDASREQTELLEALADSVAAGIAAVRPGVRLSEVAEACEEALAASAHARRHGVPNHLMAGFWGHGLGLGFEPPWIGSDSEELIDEGWCLAIERRAAVPGLGGAQHEDDLIVTADGAELLTATR